MLPDHVLLPSAVKSLAFVAPTTGPMPWLISDANRRTIVMLARLVALRYHA